MTTCLRKRYSFGLLSVSFVNVYLFLCVYFFTFCFFQGAQGGVWDLIV